MARQISEREFAEMRTTRFSEQEIATSRDWGTEREAVRWIESLQWWVGRCSFCTGNGVSGAMAAHSLADCAAGWQPYRRHGLEEAVFREGIRAEGGCGECAVPQEYCGRWARDADGRWSSAVNGRCQYGTLVYDTVIGLVSSDPRFYDEIFARFLDEAYFDEISDENLARWLGERRTVGDVQGCVWMRELHHLTMQVQDGR